MASWRDQIIEAYDMHRGGIARLKCDQNLSLDCQQSLIVSTTDAGTSNSPPCSNSAPDREPCWLEPPWLESQRFSPYSFLLLVGKVCAEAKVIDCRRRDCKLTKQKMQESAPG